MSFHDHSDMPDRLEAERYYNQPDYPEPPLSDADFIWDERSKAEERGEFDYEIFDVPPFCMFDVGGRPCIYPAGHDGDHMPLPTEEEIHGADPG